jgi:hypothetical protein
MNALRAIALFVGITALYHGLIFASAALTGAGHGSYFFFNALLAPFSTIPLIAPIGLVLWPVVALLLALRRFSVCRKCIEIILAIHYFGILIVCAQTDWHYVHKVWRSMPGLVAGFVAVYVCSQVFMWKLLRGKPQLDPARAN